MPTEPFRVATSSRSVLTVSAPPVSKVTTTCSVRWARNTGAASRAVATVTYPAPARAAARAQRTAAPGNCAEPARINGAPALRLSASRARRGKQVEKRRVVERVKSVGVSAKRCVVDTDIGNPQFARVAARRLEQEPGLHRRKRDGRARAHRVAGNRTGERIDAAWNIDCKHVTLARVETANGRKVARIDRKARPGAEESVDGERRAGERFACRRIVARHFVRAVDDAVKVGELRGGGARIPAVIARPGEGDDAAARRNVLAHIGRDCGTRVMHERIDASRSRQPARRRRASLPA